MKKILIRLKRWKIGYVEKVDEIYITNDDKSVISMINSKKIMYSAGKNDECLTLEYAVKPILEYIPANAVVWCPFDKENSEFVKLIKEQGHKVIVSHIDSAPKLLFMEKDLQLLMFDKRMMFSNNGVILDKITFSCSYFCWNFLPKQIVMKKLF